MCAVPSLQDTGTLLLLILYLAANYGEAWCPKSNTTGPLRYSREMNNATFIMAGHQISLDCCITGFSTLAWSFRAGENETWQPILATKIYRPQENNRNQTLLIVPPEHNDSFPQTGSYRCVATNTQNHTLIHQIKSFLADSKGREQPQVIGPSSNPCAELGRTITVNCSGDFGLLDPMLRIVEWFYYDNGNITFLSTLNDSRITYNINNRTIGQSSSQLVIQNVTDADLNKTFLCYVSSVRIKYNKRFEFVIQPCPKIVQMTPVNKAKVIGIAGGAIMAIIILIGLPTIVVYLYKPQIQCRLQDVFKQKGQWMQLQNNDLQFDLMLFHGDVSRDCDLGTRLESDLRNANFSVARFPIVTQEIDDATADNATVNGIIENLQRKSAALVVVSPSDNSDEGSLARLRFILPLMDSNDNVTVIYHENEKTEQNIQLKGYTHLTYEPPGRERRRNNFLCALKLRIRAAKKRRQRRMQIDHQEGII